MKKGKIDSISMADGQCGYAYGGRIYTASQFKNLYAQGGVHSDEAQDRALISKMIAENEAQHGEKETPDNMGDGGEKKKTFQRTGPEGYHEDVKDPKSKKVFSGGVDKKGNKTYSLLEDMTDVNIAAGGGQRNIEPTDNTEQPQTITNPVASASQINRAPAPSSTQQNTQAPVDGQTFSGSFSQAFGSARKSGLKTFTWNGKLFGTKLATESDQGQIADNSKREGVISNSQDKEQSTLGRKITPEAEKMYAKMYNKLPDESGSSMAKNTSYDEFRKKKDASKKLVASAVNKKKGVAQDNTKVDLSKVTPKAGI